MRYTWTYQILSEDIRPLLSNIWSVWSKYEPINWVTECKFFTKTNKNLQGSKNPY
jgi:hypothetical protein